MSTRLVLCLVLLCASFPLMAREARMLSANGDNGGGCQDSAAHGDDNVPHHNAVKQPAHAARPVKPKADPSRGDNLGEPRPPRWHSFLPGMFR